LTDSIKGFDPVDHDALGQLGILDTRTDLADFAAVGTANAAFGATARAFKRYCKMSSQDTKAWGWPPDITHGLSTKAERVLRVTAWRDRVDASYKEMRFHTAFPASLLTIRRLLPDRQHVRATPLGFFFSVEFRHHLSAAAMDVRALYEAQLRRSARLWRGLGEARQEEELAGDEAAVARVQVQIDTVRAAFLHFFAYCCYQTPFLAFLCSARNASGALGHCLPPRHDRMKTAPQQFLDALLFQRRVEFKITLTSRPELGPSPAEIRDKQQAFWRRTPAGFDNGAGGEEEGEIVEAVREEYPVTSIAAGAKWRPPQPPVPARSAGSFRRRGPRGPRGPVELSWQTRVQHANSRIREREQRRGCRPANSRTRERDLGTEEIAERGRRRRRDGAAASSSSTRR